MLLVSRTKDWYGLGGAASAALAASLGAGGAGGDAAASSELAVFDLGAFFFSAMMTISNYSNYKLIARDLVASFLGKYFVKKMKRGK